MQTKILIWIQNLHINMIWVELKFWWNFAEENTIEMSLDSHLQFWPRTLENWKIKIFKE
jgi:hypothetical protein